jgi:hypothetical protein
MLDAQDKESQGEENKQSQFAKLKKLLLVARKIFIFYYVLLTGISMLSKSGIIGLEIYLVVAVVGFVIYLIHGIYISIYNHRVRFKFGKHAGYLLPLLTILVWWWLLIGFHTLLSMIMLHHDVIANMSYILSFAMVFIFIPKLGYERILSELQKWKYTQ